MASCWSVELARSGVAAASNAAAYVAAAAAAHAAACSDVAARTFAVDAAHSATVVAVVAVAPDLILKVFVGPGLQFEGITSERLVQYYLGNKEGGRNINIEAI